MSKQKTPKVGDEWITPPWLIEIVKSVGQIDCDPCSSERGNLVVGASAYGTKDDPITIRGSVWLNPPYSDPSPHVANLLNNISDGRVHTAWLLVNSSTTTKWYQAAMQKRSAALLFSRRIAFVNPFTMLEDKGNRYDSTLFYFGAKVSQMRDAFMLEGVIV